MLYRGRFVAACALILIVSLTACGSDAGADAAQRAATERFLTERNDGTPVVLSEDDPNAPVMGMVEQVDGTTISVKGPLDKSRKTVQLGEATQILKQTEVQPTELKVGDTITAFGTEAGEVFQARDIQIGGTGSLMSPDRVVTIERGHAPPDGTPAPLEAATAVVLGAPDAAQADSFAAPLSGTVTQVTGSTLTVKTADKETTVQLVADTKAHKQVPAQAAEIQTGMFILAVGTRNGETLEATQVEILPPPTMTTR